MKRPVNGTRVSLGLKVTAETKKRIDAAARKSGRTQSQEAEYRIELSYQLEQALKLIEKAMQRSSDRAKAPLPP